jgi:hypothetical protein
MTSKQKVVAELGEADLLLSGRIALSLTANDQIKYYFGAFADSAVKDNDFLDDVVAGSRKDRWRLQDPARA